LGDDKANHIKLVKDGGFNLAFAVSDAKTGEVVTVDKKYGNIDIYFENTRMTIESCASKDAFYKTAKIHKDEIDKKFSSFTCISKSSLDQVILKHGDTAENNLGKLFSVYFNPCDLVTYNECKSKETIAEWSKNKVLNVLYNQQSFNYRKADDNQQAGNETAIKDLIVKESRVKKMPMLSADPQHYKFELLKTSV